MSHSYRTSTYSVQPDDLPARLESPDQLTPMSSSAFLEQQASPDKLIYVSGDTRSGWALFVLKALIEAVELPSLAFLTDRGQHRFETEYGFTDVAVLERSSLASVASDLERLLELVKGNPMLAMDADSDGSMFGVEEVATAVARDYVSSKPAYDYGNVAGDEGQGADYFFTWLRSVLRVVEVARSDGRAVVHVLKV